MHSENCRLCGSLSEEMGGSFGDGRVFFRCDTCGCAFVGLARLPSLDEEKSRYQQHQNDATPEYEAFLRRLAAPLQRRLAPGARGLDFGCGPVPVMASLFEKQGFPTVSFDPIFFAQRELLTGTFDFITCSETAEHFHQPARDFAELDRMLKPGAWLGVMTQMRSDWAGFFEWHYPRDPTHVVFYTARTMRWIARRWNWDLSMEPENVAIFRKAAGPSAKAT